ncbi:MAG TPA: hypothetical protein VFK03_01380 [Candidatus Saccharimonadales bacterium]|nr:hypothetical protein [Candidatus Saccharimonadales bacterium]
MPDRPTKVQSELLDFIDSFIQDHGYGPSYREIMRSLNYKSVSTVAVHVDNLIKIGHLKKTDRSARSLVVVDENQASQSKSDALEARWLIDAVQAKLADYKAAPNDNKRRELETLAGALEILDLTQAAGQIRAELNQKPLA